MCQFRVRSSPQDSASFCLTALVLGEDPASEAVGRRVTGAGSADATCRPWGVGMSLRQSPAPVPLQVAAKTPRSETEPPPVMIYLPAMWQRAANSTSRIAELMAIKLTNGPGTFHTQEVLSPSPQLRKWPAHRRGQQRPGS